MASESSDDSSSSEITKDYTSKVSNDQIKSHINSNKLKLRHRNKPKHQGDYNTFVVPEILCQCQQKCTERVTASLIQKVSMYFFGLRESKDKQKSYLASLILGREKQIDMNALKGKRVRKMSYRYFVPILTDKDLKEQSEENSSSNCEEDLKNVKCKKVAGKFQIHSMFKEKNWDHIEVCLKAFTSVHIISEKKVIVTRSVCELNLTIRCSRPFQKEGSNNDQVHLDKNGHKTASTEGTNSATASGTSDICAATAAWLTQYNNTTFPVNPKTFLPEGLILPDSMICVPIFADGNQRPRDPDQDVDIIDNFFFNQLWKPEYMSDSSNNNAKKM